MVSRFEAFKVFRQNHEDWGGKNQFFLYHHKLRFNRTESLSEFLLRSCKSKIFFENNIHFLCDFHLNGNFVPLFCVDSDKEINFKIEIPEEVKKAISTIKEFVESI